MEYKIQNPTDIKIGPRQRIDIGDLTDLSTILDPKIGQIYPIIVDRDNNLLDGFRRLTFCLRNNIQVKTLTRFDEDDDYTKQLIELYADIGRKDRTWQERCLAYLTLHTMQPGKTIRHWASVLGESKANVAAMLIIARELRRSVKQETESDKEFWAATGSTQAYKILLQRNIKAVEDEMNRRKALGAQVITTTSITGGGKNLQSISKDTEGFVEDDTTIFTMVDGGEVFSREVVNERPKTKISIHGHTCEPPTCQFALLYSQDEPFYPPDTGACFQFFSRYVDFIDGWNKNNGAVAKFCPIPIIWNLILGRSFTPFPFIANTKPIAFIYGKDFTPPNDNLISSVIVEPIDDNSPNSLPDGLVQTLLDSICREGDLVRCEFRDAIAVARSGRVPVWVNPDAEGLRLEKNILMAHYKQVLGENEVEFV